VTTLFGFHWWTVLRHVPFNRRGDTNSVRDIAGEFHQLAPASARHLAAFAYVPCRAARADLSINRLNTDCMVAVMQRIGSLSPEQTMRLVELAKARDRAFGVTEDFLVTREFRRIPTVDQWRELLECLFLVSLPTEESPTSRARRSGKPPEHSGFSHHHYVALRIGWTHKQDALKRIDRNLNPARASGERSPR
jgi:hypothetical protein